MQNHEVSDKDDRFLSLISVDWIFFVYCLNTGSGLFCFRMTLWRSLVTLGFKCRFYKKMVLYLTLVEEPVKDASL